MAYEFIRFLQFVLAVLDQIKDEWEFVINPDVNIHLWFP